MNERPRTALEAVQAWTEARRKVEIQGSGVSIDDVVVAADDVVELVEAEDIKINTLIPDEATRHQLIQDALAFAEAARD